MRTILNTELSPLNFKEENGFEGRKLNVQSNKIGWIHATTDSEEADFDVVIKDSLGRTKAEKRGCHASVSRYGELINIPTIIGEEIEICVENVKGAKSIDVFIN